MQAFQLLFRRIMGMLLVVYLAATFSFFAIHLVPGDPAEAAFARSTAPPSVLQQRRAELGLDKPVFVQYVNYIVNLAQGNLGTSWQSGVPVNQLIASQFAYSANLAILSMFFGLLIGTLLGILPSFVEPVFASTLRSLSGVLLGFPVMFSGILLIWLVAIQLDLLPATGQGSFSHLLLPALTIGLSVSGAIAHSLDSGLTASLRQSFVLAAFAKGLSRRAVILRHALPVGILPTLNLVALQVGFLLSGTVVTESLFSRQGLGRLLLNAVLEKDLPVIQAAIVLSALIYGLLSLLVDSLQSVIDPRMREA